MLFCAPSALHYTVKVPPALSTRGRRRTPHSRARGAVAMNARSLHRRQIHHASQPAFRMQLSREHQRRRAQVACRSASNTLSAVALFLTPGMLTLAYAAYKGRGNVSDGLSHVLTQVSQGYLQPDAGGKNIPVAEGDLSEFTGSYISFLYQIYVQRDVNKDLNITHERFLEKGPVFRLAFGPKSFIVVSDPVLAKHILREIPEKFSKGVLAEILEPIMGKGLIPADLETWKKRRRAIVPAFHQAYLNAMVSMFVACTQRSVDKLGALIDDGDTGKTTINMEDEFLSLGLDIIGLGVFNYDFGSVTKESAVIKSVYRCLREAEHRSTFYFPYWNIPGARYVVPRLREFHANLDVLDTQLDALIKRAVNTKQEDDIEALQARDYANIRDPSLLRFLTDMRGEDISGKQLRDDLMTFLIAGHETTAAVLTWAVFCLTQAPGSMRRLQREVDDVLGDSKPDIDTIKRMPCLRNVRTTGLSPALTIAEALRLYPQPPVLIRRNTEALTLPQGTTAFPDGFELAPGCDIFLSTWNLHRSPQLWERPNEFEPERFERTFANSEAQGWDGYRPSAQGSSMYPNEVSSDFAFLPFGGGSRKCVGDQFAMLEAAVALAMLLRRFDFELAARPEDIGMTTGATIHTERGMFCHVRRREAAGSGSEIPSESVAMSV